MESSNTTSNTLEKFEATLSKEDYAIKLLTDRGMKKSSIAKVVMALVKIEPVEDKEEMNELIEQLQTYLQYMVMI